MQKLIALLTRVDDLAAKLERVLLVGLIALMLLLTAGNVIVRQFASGFPWADELARFLMIWVGFLGASMATRRRRHITIDVATKSMSEKNKTRAALLTDLLGALICSFLAVVGILYVLRNKEFGDLSPAMKMPYWIIQAIIPMGLAAIGVRFGLRFLIDVQALRTGEYEKAAHAEESLF